MENAGIGAKSSPEQDERLPTLDMPQQPTPPTIRRDASDSFERTSAISCRAQRKKKSAVANQR